jgi:phycobilisome core-membrane linker protein
MEQGVTSIRDQMVIFDTQALADKKALDNILKAAYRQIFERDISVFSSTYEFIAIDEAFLSKKLTVKGLILKLGLSKLYAKEFYSPYPNTKVIELGTKHFLGRAPKNQAEIRFYNQILASKGLNAFVSLLIESEEYQCVFGDSTVPYRRFPTLPAANFPNTSKLYETFTKQNNKIIIPSFIA